MMQGRRHTRQPEKGVIQQWASEAVLASADLSALAVGPYATLCSWCSPSDPCTAMS